MISVDFGLEKPSTVRQKLERGYRARRNFLILELFSMLVHQTPRKTGLARGNWQISIGARTGSTLTRTDYDGNSVVVEELAKLKGASAFARVYLENNLGYIDDLERGSSGQAPEGIARVVVPAFRTMYGDAL